MLADDGVLWLNMGDSYFSDHSPGGTGFNSTINSTGTQEQAQRVRANGFKPKRGGLKPKDLVGQPWRLALALQADGWYLRSDVVWRKPNPMPESVEDRPTKAHEYVFLLSKSERYYYDAEAVRERTTGNAHNRGKGGVNPKVSSWADGAGISHSPIAHNRTRGKKDVDGRSERSGRGPGWRNKQNPSASASLAGGPPSKRHAKHAAVDERISGGRMYDNLAAKRAETGSHDAPFGEYRNMRSVWDIPTEAFAGAHFATFPRELVRRCILAASRPGDIVVDPFHGTGTTGQVALELGRHYVAVELNGEYVDIGRQHRPAALGFPL